jgi:hypothetical protein
MAAVSRHSFNIGPYLSISADNAESKRMDTGPSLDTIDQNVTNDQSGLFKVMLM